MIKLFKTMFNELKGVYESVEPEDSKLNIEKESQLIAEVEELDDFTAKDLHGIKLKMIYEKEAGLLLGEDDEGIRYVLASTDDNGKIT